MKKNDQDDALDPAQRVRQIKQSFRSVCDTLAARIAELNQEVTPDDAKALRAKIAELESAHLSLVKAEEAFHEKSKEQADDDGPDYRAVRIKIRSALDRVIAAESARHVSGGTE